MNPTAKNELVPTGKLRVGVNLGNFLLVNKDAASGELRGVVPDLAQELARRLGATVELVSYPGAGHAFFPVPYFPQTMTEWRHPVNGALYAFGGNPESNERATVDSWRRIKDFLRENL